MTAGQFGARSLAAMLPPAQSAAESDSWLRVVQHRKDTSAREKNRSPGGLGLINQPTKPPYCCDLGVRMLKLWSRRKEYLQRDGFLSAQRSLGRGWPESPPEHTWRSVPCARRILHPESECPHRL